MSKSEVRNIVKKYAEKLEANKYPLTFVYLFGSYARGNQNESSDIDVAVVSPVLRDAFNKEAFKLWRLRRGIDLRIEPHAFSPEDFVNETSSIVREIKTTGERIV